MLMTTVEAEVAAYIEAHQHEVDEQGRRLVVRNGRAQERTLVSGVGPIKIRAPRVNDRRVDEQGRKFRFTSEILPPYLRRAESVLTEAVEQNPLIEVSRREVSAIPAHSVVVIASGPLTSDPLAAAIAELTGSERLFFHDAISPSRRRRIDRLEHRLSRLALGPLHRRY